ncbi:MAG: hypothetical protein A2091_03405 [Desulfuromonadales bacterium GWD2_61_12]|nr:MAG: hypothetical protein A2005_06275 [Desulfuromonadales bacterium GWC2_61_20]OGR34949.1 MAG: hypothetical protein A2091_03405 [Desulfuromonadales bacterium GWD2_61_12]HAD04440.1 cytochrome C [Desulfuromonas sp.]
MRSLQHISLSVLFILMTSVAFAAPAAKLQGAHADKKALPRSCQACHRGMQMVIDGEEGTCLACHGSDALRQTMVRKGFLKDRGVADLRDIESELRKPYNHPVLTVRGAHRSTETLPEEVTNAKRHSECVDCHDPHLTEKEKPFRGIKGRRVINQMAEIAHEYELCYKCHSTSVNLPAFATDKAAEFRTTNPSFHPVEGEGRLAFVVSLKEPYAARKASVKDLTTISCSDCHGSDAADGPKGPHGSNFSGLLRYNYEMDDARSESEYTYALCYECHSRTSILANESFAYHALHIEGNRSSGQLGTSCFTCHDAHGSTVNPYLLRFNEEFVRPNSEGKLEYLSTGVAARHGSCSLTCHGSEHKIRAY